MTNPPRPSLFEGTVEVSINGYGAYKHRVYNTEHHTKFCDELKQLMDKYGIEALYGEEGGEVGITETHPSSKEKLLRIHWAWGDQLVFEMGSET